MINKVKNKIKIKITTAFTLAEVMVVFAVIAVVATATLGITKLQLNYAAKCMYYAAFKNLGLLTGTLVSEGSSITTAADPGNPGGTISGTFPNYQAAFDAFETFKFADTSFRSCFDGCNANDDCINQYCLAAQAADNDATNAYLTALDNTVTATNPPQQLFLKTWLDSSYTLADATYSVVVPPTPPSGGSTTIKKTLPDKGYAADGTGLCNRVTNMMNTIGTLHCSDDVQYTNGSNFATATPTFVASNGIAYYNFGRDPVLDNVNHDPAVEYFNVYVDIDGTHRGKSQLNVDVMNFRLMRNGKVLPAPDSIGGNSTDYLSTSVSYETFAAGRVVNWLAKGIPYRQAACISGEVTDPTYCIYPPGSVKDAAHCVSNVCEVVINKP